MRLAWLGVAIGAANIAVSFWRPFTRSNLVIGVFCLSAGILLLSLGRAVSVEVECDECRTEPKAGIICESCMERKLDEAREQGERDADPQNCDLCGDHPADCCYNCATGSISDKVRDYADRRKMLGLMTPEVFAEFELFIDDCEAR